MATENAAVKNVGASKMRGWKMWDWINRQQTEGLENARQASMDSQKSYWQDVPLTSNNVSFLIYLDFYSVKFLHDFVIFIYL